MMEQQMDTMDGPCFDSLPIEIQQHIFSYCGTKTRLKITLVCKGWAEALRYFREDFQLYLHHCSLRENLEPFSLLMNSTRRFHSINCGDGIHSESTEVQTRFFSFMGREVQVLDLAEWRTLKRDPDFLLLFPHLKKLTVSKLVSLNAFKSFPKTLENVHLKELSIMEDLEHLHSIKSLNLLLTSDSIHWQNDSLPAQSWILNSGTAKVYTLDENLKVFLKSMSTWQEHFFKSNKNFLDFPTITFDDVSGMNFQGPPSTFFSFNNFPNLRSIRIVWSKIRNPRPICFNFHQSVLCAGVAELEIYDNKQSCIKCFKSIIDSFPTVKKIVLQRCTVTNQHLKYIFFKLPKLIHLETDSENLNHEIICHDQPEYSIGNLMLLESLILPKLCADNVLLDWPFMPHLKEVQFGELPDDHVLNYFTAKTPNLQSFDIGRGSLVTGTGIEIIAKNWPNLRTLRLSSTKPCDLSPIKQFCRNLRTLQLDRGFQLVFNSVYTNTSFFDKIPTLRELKDGAYTKYRYL